MNDFSAFNADLRGAALLWITLLIFTFVFVLIRYIQLKQSRARIACTVAEVTAAFLTQQVLIQAHQGAALVRIPAAAVFALSLTLTVFSVLEIINLGKWRNKHLSPMSIKESLDSLPTGLCFYREGGLPKLTNRKMSELCRLTTGGSLSDAEAFWDELQSGSLKHSVKGGENPIVCLPDGTAYSFARHTAELEGSPIFEIIASDITEQYRLSAELREKQKQASLVNTRLKALNATIGYVIMDKELLQMKINIHDSFGHTLLMTRLFLTDPERVDKEEMLGLWRRNVMLLKDEEREGWQQPYFVNRQHAAVLGISIETEGELPEEEELIPITDTAITVHVTNVFRHANGTRAIISSVKTDDGYVIRFTNDGIAPTGNITENGGLANLRKEVEDIGGEMEVIGRPKFELILKLPADVKEGI